MTKGREPPPITNRDSAAPRPRDPSDRAVGPRDCDRDDVLLNAARPDGADLLLDQVFFPLNTQALAAFQELLDNPPAPTDRLRRLMLTKAPWE